jgi:hypothetical protein
LFSIIVTSCSDKLIATYTDSQTQFRHIFEVLLKCHAPMHEALSLSTLLGLPELNPPFAAPCSQGGSSHHPRPFRGLGSYAHTLSLPCLLYCKLLRNFLIAHTSAFFLTVK